MELDFKDRLLTCSDCHGEFVFTAGEQIFFFDKQFKNDPKRCKPCKSRRSGLAAAASGLTGPAAAGLSRTETRTECSQCGIETTVPFKPTQGRPVLCRLCFQRRGLPVAAAGEAAALTNAQTVSALEGLTQAESGTLPQGAAVRAAASIASAHAGSSVSTPHDLATLTATEASPAQVPATPLVPTHILVAGERSDQAPVLELTRDISLR